MLLELVQNADDAGASEVAIMLDGRSYPTDSVLGRRPDSTSCACIIAATLG